MWKRVFLLLYFSVLQFEPIKGDVNFTVVESTTDRQLGLLNKVTNIQSKLESLKEESIVKYKLESPTKAINIESKLGSLKKLISRIVNGTRAAPDQFPQQVSLRSSSGAHFCGGSILTQKWVLTAAHCIWAEKLGTIIDPRDVWVVAGEIYLKKIDNARASSKVLRIVKHPDFTYRTLHNDLALLKLETPICFNNHVHSIPIAKAPTQANAVCQVSGWGYQQSGGNLVSYELLYVDLPIVDIPLCRKLMAGYTDVPTGMMCAGYMEGGRDACQGDSGGGMVCSGLLTGVVSGGEGCALPKLPGVYADIHVYTNWIEKYVDFSKEVKFCSSASTFSSSLFATTIAVIIILRIFEGHFFY